MGKSEILCRIGLFPRKDGTKAAGDGAKFSYSGSRDFVIGSAKESDLKIEGQGIAERHLRVLIKDRQISLEALSESHTTRVGGGEAKPGGPVAYKAGDAIQLGNHDSFLALEIFAPMSELAELEAQACIESEQLVAKARVQAEEKIRKAIEEGHSQVQSIEQEAERRAKSTAQSLIESAKSEVDVLISQAQATGSAIVREAEVRKKSLLQEIDDATKTLAEAQHEIDALKSEAAQCEAACGEARRRKQECAQELERAEAESQKAKTALASLKASCKDSESEWQGIQQQIQRGKETNSQVAAEVTKTQERLSELKREEGALRTRFDALIAEVAATEENKKLVTLELEKLEQTRTSELMKLREQVDAEYKRQLAAEAGKILELREQALLVQTQVQARFAELDTKWTIDLITGVNERLWQLIGDRAALYGIPTLKDNPEFRTDVAELATRALSEGFEQRRTRLLESITPAETLVRRRRFNERAKTYCGWIAAVLLLGFMVSGAVLKQEPPRGPASSSQGH